MIEIILSQLFETLLYTYNDIPTILRLTETSSFMKEEFRKSGSVWYHIQILKEIHGLVAHASDSFFHGPSKQINFLRENIEIRSDVATCNAQDDPFLVVSLHIIFWIGQETGLTKEDVTNLVYTLTPALKHIPSNRLLIEVHKVKPLLMSLWQLRYRSPEVIYDDIEDFVSIVSNQQKGIRPRVHRLGLVTLKAQTE
jgi:hypothetical protein